MYFSLKIDDQAFLMLKIDFEGTFLLHIDVRSTFFAANWLWKYFLVKIHFKNTSLQKIVYFPKKPYEATFMLQTQKNNFSSKNTFFVIPHTHSTVT